MKGIKKNKQILILENEKRHADLKIKLKHYGLTQSEFFRGCVSGLLNEDKHFLDFFFSILEEKSYIRSKRKRKENRRLINKGLRQVDNFGLGEEEINNIFDLIEKEHPDL